MDQKAALIAASDCDGSSAIENLLMNEISDVSSVLEAIDFMTGVEVRQFFSKMSSFASETSMILLADEESFCVDDDVSLQAKQISDSESVEKLKKLALIVLKYMEVSKTNSPELLSIVQILHDGLMILSDDVPGAISYKVTVARICEKCWVNKVEDPENYVLQLIPYLLGAALRPAAHDSDVKRLYNIRTALYELDFEDESIENMRNLLLRCFIHSAFLRASSDGRKFLSFIFTINEGKSYHNFHFIKTLKASYTSF